jgi:hypothetical protein
VAYHPLPPEKNFSFLFFFKYIPSPGDCEGVLKFATLGFFFIGHLVDVILIATQTLGPADNSSYVIDYFGARMLFTARQLGYTVQLAWIFN